MYVFQTFKQSTFMIFIFKFSLYKISKFLSQFWTFGLIPFSKFKFKFISFPFFNIIQSIFISKSFLIPFFSPFILFTLTTLIFWRKSKSSWKFSFSGLTSLSYAMFKSKVFIVLISKNVRFKIQTIVYTTTLKITKLSSFSF